MVDGCFDPIHCGHLLYFEKAAKLNLPILCNIASDSIVRKKRPDFLPISTRAAIIDALKPISFVHVNTRSTAEVLARLKPLFYVKGKEWKNKLPKDQIDICKVNGTKILFTDTKIDSSSRILNDYFRRRLKLN